MTVIDNIINDNPCIGLLIDGDPTRSCQGLPLTINVVSEIDEGGSDIGRPKRHDCVRPFDCICALKGKLLLTRLSNSKLMITRRGIKKPEPSAVAKFNEYR